MKQVCLMFGMLLFLGASLFGQQIRVSGTVTDQADGSTLPGVTVLVKGSMQGTITDANGLYNIQADGNAVLVFSFIGMKTIEVPVSGRSIVNVVMSSDVFAIEEFVVVGYGIQQKREVSGAIASVRGDDLKTIPVQSFDQALQGKASGVNITVPNAVLGNPPVIRVRGYNSISGSSSPLVVVDGVPVFTGDLSRNSTALNVLGDINPSDIASIEILKDASATAIYGSRAANGVMLITTKRGQQGRVNVNYDASIGFSSPYRLYDLMNAEQFVATKNLARANANNLPPAYFLHYDKDGKLIDTDWNKEVYQTGFQHNHALTVSGATQATSYFLSLGFAETDGILKTNTYDRKNARLNLDHKLTRRISLGANINYTSSFSTAPNTGSLSGQNFSTAGAGRLAFITAPNIAVFLDNGDYNVDFSSDRVGRMTNTEACGFSHPTWLQDHNYHNVQGDRIISTIYANVELVENLIFRTTYGMDNSGIENKTYWHPDHGDGRSWEGRVYNYFDRRNRWNWTNTLNYSTSVAEKLMVRALIGNEEQYTHENGWSASKMGLSDVFFRDYQGSFRTPMQPPVALLTEEFFTSFFGRLNFDWDRKYYVEVSGRRDGFSGLAPGNKFGNFGGASLMWNLSREGFFQNSKLSEVFSDIRMKASVGRVGNISGVDSYASLFLYSAGTYNQQSTLFFDQAGNAGLGWETSDKYDVGLAFAMFNDRIQVDLNYFNNDVNGLILDVPQSPSKGIPGHTLPMNVGSLKNTGIEFTVNSYNINKPDFSWNSSFNITYLKNEITSLADGVPWIVGMTGNGNEATNRTMVGHPIGMIWGVETAGVCPQTGRRIFIRRNEDGTTSKVYYNHQSGQPTSGWRNEDGTVSRTIGIANDGVALGSPIPKFYGGFDNNFSYKGFDMGITMTFALDFYVYNGSKAGLRDMRHWNNLASVADTYWKNVGDITDIPRPVWNDNVSNGSTMVQSQNVERADFLKIRNLSLGYTFRNELLRQANVNSLRLYAQVFNAFTFTGYTGADPEISSMGDTNLVPGVDRNSVPQARTIALGINLTF